MNGHLDMERGRERNRAVRGFTLIEMLVVIAIIAILAAMTVAGMSRARGAASSKRIESEMRQIETGIASYHAAMSFYPPDNPVASNIPYATNNNPMRPYRGVTNQLYYELMGTVLVGPANNKEFETVNKAERISPANIQRFFGVEGLANSTADASESKQPFLVPKAGQFAEISVNPDVEVLVVPGDWKGPAPQAPVPNQKINPWRYDSSSTNRHNPSSYDLWAEYYVGNRKIIKGNWKE